MSTTSIDKCASPNVTITGTCNDEKTPSTANNDNNTAIGPDTVTISAAAATTTTITSCIQETIIYEWVLLVPPQLTKSTYQLLLKYNNIVARGWHLDGRYGSRTHRYMLNNDTLYIGIPIRCPEILIYHSELSFNTKMIIPNNEQHQNNTINDDDVKCIQSLDNLCDNCTNLAVSSNTTVNATVNPLKDLLQKEGCRIYIVYKPYVQATNRNLHRPIFDATIYPERQRNKNIISSSVLTSITKEEQEDKTTTTTKDMHSFTYMELFAGIGGFGIALEALGGKCVFVSEIDEICQLIYKLNFPHNESVLYGDIYTVPDSVFTSIHDKQQQHIDILVGGFPCQPFSTLGKQNGINDSKGILFLQIVRVLQLCNPTVFILENVQGLLQMKETYTIILNAFSNCNYTVSTNIIDSRCLTATTRKRLYFIGIKNNNQPSHNQQQQAIPTFEFPYMPDLLIRANDVITYETAPIRKDDKLSSTTTTTTASTLSSTSLNIIDGIDIKHLYVSDEQLIRLNEQKYWKPSKLAWPDTTCDTLISHYGTSIGRGHSQLVPTYSNPRRFTPKECSRIMGFPNTYKLPSYTTTIPISELIDCTDKCDCNENNDSHNNVSTDDSTSKVNNNTATSLPFVHLKQQYKVFGNAVCPPIIAALAGAVLHCCPTIAGYHHHYDWTQYGLEVAIDLAKKATIPKTE